MTSTALPRPPRPSASNVVVRGAPGGFEVLMLKRADKGDQNSGAWVFPGGGVDASDRDCHAVCAGLDDAQASTRLDLAEGGLDYYVAAIRESFEEAGVLFALDAHGTVPAVDPSSAGLRVALAHGERNFLEFLQESGWRLAADRLHYIAHWVTPLGMPKRFDTRFFLSVLPDEQEPVHDGQEIVEHGWFTPTEVLASSAMKMLAVTRSILEMLPRCAHLDELTAWARAPRTVRVSTRRRSRTSSGPLNVPAEHPAWDELGRLDPTGEGTTWSELRPGVPVRLSGRVQRVPPESAAEANGYVIGDKTTGWALVDPCPADRRQVEAMLAITGSSCRAILLTGGCAMPPGIDELARRAGATVHRAADATEPLRVLEGSTLQPVPLPQGHGWLLQEERTLFSGACMLDPEVAAAMGADWIAPGLGFLRAAGRGAAP